MRDDLQILAALGIDPTRLDPAPDGPLRHSGYQARINPPTQAACSSCGAPAIATCRLTIPGLGRRWKDACRDCLLARWSA